MAIPLPAKLASGVLVGGTLAAGGSFLYKGTSNSKTYSIKDLLASKNPEKRLISSSYNDSSVEWKAVWKAYKDTYQNKDGNPFSLTSVQFTSDTNVPSEFINSCESWFMKQVVDDKDERYKTVLSYCTRDTLVKDLILESNRKLVSDSGGNWNEIWKDYRKVNEGKEKGKDTWQLTDWETKKDQDSSVSEDLPKKCKEKLEGKSGGSSVNDYQDVVNWCSIPK
ncbi:hypothetical protein MHC_01135 [Mycoplasma haemocanis str. Illinois]|uniref:Uncharacterized protein n=1 Tax=Mycoplasma haemocanis (strain Illinois) TaxID=1111676 RepID=H6N621_MYCHN|nr:hypothetical protein [Mycoplasma haemocanis]AEW45093.1 hypothetical protein MHC_01135 [Mycoplasma haemocanis str. Illinois]